MRVLIVDDEAPARARLRRLLVAQAGVEIVGEAGDGTTALAMIGSLAPELVLLDIQMPGRSGLDLAASLPEPRPVIIFVTAYDAYALRAFEVAACDYLLKPVDPDRLAQALQRVAAPRALPMPPTQLLIPDRGRTHVVPVAQITWLEAADNYVVVHTAQRAPLLRRTLAALLADLGPGFVRAHRSAAVSMAQVLELRPGTSGDGSIILRDGSVVPYSRQHRATLVERLAGKP